MSRNMDRWTDLRILLEDKRVAMNELDKLGMVISDDLEANAALRRIFTSIFMKFSDIIMECGTLSLVYTYSQIIQPPELAKNDGFSSTSEHLDDGRRVSSIGVSVEALMYSEEYAAMIILHELTHVLISGNHEHDEEFHRFLDGLVSEYNSQYGTDLQNDYFGLVTVGGQSQDNRDDGGDSMIKTTREDAFPIQEDGFNPAEKNKLLVRRARRELEKAGYELRQREGSFLVLNAKSQKPLAQFESIEDLGKIFGLWGDDLPATPDYSGPPGRDSQGRDTPELAAVREKAYKPVPRVRLPDGSLDRKGLSDAHHRK